jgi:transcriptional regulator with XRE-family HTH domain
MDTRGPAEVFADNLKLVMERLNLSRVELAHRLGVEKSIVRRWVLGGARPSEANLSLLTALVAREVEGFTRAHWQEPADRIAVVLGLAPAAPATHAAGFADLLPHFAARAEAGQPLGLDRYGGLWVQFYAPIAPAGVRPIFCGGVKIALEHGRLWYHVSDGARGVWTGGGPAFAADGRLWVLLEEYRGRSDLCTIVYNGSAGQKAMIVDGLALARAANAGGVPVCGRFTLVRLADLPASADDADTLFHAICDRCGELSLGDLAGRLPDWVVEVLLGDTRAWSERHQAFVLALTEADNLTTDAIDVAMLPAGGGTRADLVAAARALFAEALAMI